MSVDTGIQNDSSVNITLWSNVLVSHGFLLTTKKEFQPSHSGGRDQVPPSYEKDT